MAKEKSGFLRAWICLAAALSVALAALVLQFWPMGPGAPEPPDSESAPALAVMVAGQPLDTRFVVVLDAGHGGFDPGAVSGDGDVTEAQANQAMAERVMTLLQRHDAVFHVRMAHEGGSYATPMQRADTAAYWEADLFLSLHLNGDVRPSTRGFSCFPMAPGRPYHEESVRFALLLAQQARGAGALVLGTDGLYYAYYIPTSTGYQKLVLDSAEINPAQPRSEDSFGVIEYPGCPAVLAELWHITSGEDMARFGTEQGMEVMAQAVYRAICEFFSVTPLDPSG